MLAATAVAGIAALGGTALAWQADASWTQHFLIEGNEDRAQIVSVAGTLTTPAGRFANVLTTDETTPLVATERSRKHYAPRVGLVQSDGLKLVRYGPARAGR